MGSNPFEHCKLLWTWDRTLLDLSDRFSEWFSMVTIEGTQALGAKKTQGIETSQHSNKTKKPAMKQKSAD